MSSYDLSRDGFLDVIAASVPNTETAPCWLVVTIPLRPAIGGRAGAGPRYYPGCSPARAVAPVVRVAMREEDP